MDISDRLKIWREHLELTQEQFAKQAGIPSRTFQSWETGEKKPGTKALEKLSNTGVNLHWLFTGQGDMDLRKTYKTKIAPVAVREQTHTQYEPADRLAQIRKYLDAMDDKKREQTLNEIFSRVQEVQRIDEMEKTIAELKKKYGYGS